jgi:hypothetical protein
MYAISSLRWVYGTIWRNETTNTATKLMVLKISHLALQYKMLNAMHIFASSRLCVLFAAAVAFCFLDVLDAFQHDCE